MGTFSAATESEEETKTHACDLIKITSKNKTKSNKGTNILYCVNYTMKRKHWRHQPKYYIHSA